jgi:hypothetical protein
MTPSRLRMNCNTMNRVTNYQIEPLEQRKLLANGLLSISITDAVVEEGDLPGTNAIFTVSIPGISTTPVSVQFQTADGTAKSGSDYTPVTGSVILSPGQTSKTIVIPITGDVQTEGTEQFVINLFNPVGAPLVRDQATATIIDNDQRSVSARATDANASELNADSGAFRITRTGPTDTALKVYYTLSGTAKNGVDYQRVAGSVNIGVGKTFANVLIKPLADNLDESNETIILKLSNRKGYTVESPRSATVNLNDRDTVAPTASLIASSVTQAGTEYQFTVTYSDNKLISAATIGNGDIQILGPNGFLRNAQLVSRTPNKNASQITAVYRMTPPGDIWDETDSGTYTINMIAGQVKDKSGKSVAAGALGTFDVTITP